MRMVSTPETILQMDAAPAAVTAVFRSATASQARACSGAPPRMTKMERLTSAPSQHHQCTAPAAYGPYVIDDDDDDSDLDTNMVAGCDDAAAIPNCGGITMVRTWSYPAGWWWYSPQPGAHAATCRCRAGGPSAACSARPSTASSPPPPAA